MAEIGLLGGLAVRNDHQDEIQNLKYFDQLNKQNQAMLEAKNRMFLEDTEFQNASNNYDAAKIREEGNAAIAELAALRKAHSNDYFTNPDVQLKARQIKQGMKSSPAVLRSIAFKDAQAKYNTIFDDYLKNPSKYDEDEINNIRQQISNYDKWGHPEGEAGAQRDGARPLTFNPPTTMKDLEDLFSVAKDINPDESVRLHNGRDGAYEKKVSDKALKELATTMYESEPQQYKRFVKAGKDPITEIMNGLRLRSKTETFNGFERDNWKEKMDYEARLKAAMQGPADVPVWKTVAMDSDNISPTDDFPFRAALGSTPTVAFKGPDGKLTTESGNDFRITNIIDKNYRSKNVGGKEVKVPYQKDGNKIVTGYFFKPMKWGEDNGILENTKWFGKKLKVKPEFADTYEVFTPPPGPDGKSVPILKVRGRFETNFNNPEYARKYEAAIKSTADQRNVVGSGSLMSQDVFKDEKGNYWTTDANGKYIPYK